MPAPHDALAPPAPPGPPGMPVSPEPGEHSSRRPGWFSARVPLWLLVVIALVALGVGLLIGFALGNSSASSASEPSAVPSASPTAPPLSPTPLSPSPVTPAPADDAPTAAQLIDALLAIDPPNGVHPPYDRDLFGQRWADVDRNGCDTRNDILGRDLLDPVFKEGTNNCKVLSGLLVDPYSGVAIPFVSGVDTSVLVQIDHLVPLAWAWANGASGWTDELRTQFANDPDNLLAVSGAENQSKSASGPSTWMPPNREYHCDYVASFAAVVLKYELALPWVDQRAMVTVLQDC